VIGILAGDNIADLKPLGDRVLIEVAEGEDQTAGGVLLTAASKEKPTMGKVRLIHAWFARDANRPLSVLKVVTVIGW
jgi:co-chaperonin GroES (HSP10)